MKRYWLFQCNDYESSPVLGDILAIGDDIEELKGKAKRLDNAWIVDTKFWITMWRGERDIRDNTYDWDEISEPVEILQEDN